MTGIEQVFSPSTYCFKCQSNVSVVYRRVGAIHHPTARILIARSMLCSHASSECARVNRPQLLRIDQARFLWTACRIRATSGGTVQRSANTCSCRVTQERNRYTIARGSPGTDHLPISFQTSFIQARSSTLCDEDSTSKTSAQRSATYTRGIPMSLIDITGNEPGFSSQLTILYRRYFTVGLYYHRPPCS
jgi:hypothetical protein